MNQADDLKETIFKSKYNGALFLYRNPDPGCGDQYEPSGHSSGILTAG